MWAQKSNCLENVGFSHIWHYLKFQDPLFISATKFGIGLHLWFGSSTFKKLSNFKPFTENCKVP